MLSGLTEIDSQQRDVLASSAQLWQARCGDNPLPMCLRRYLGLAPDRGAPVLLQMAEASAASLKTAQEEQRSLQRAVLGDLKCGNLLAVCPEP